MKHLIILFFLIFIFSASGVFAGSYRNPDCIELQKLYQNTDGQLKIPLNQTIGYLIPSYTYGGQFIEVRNELCRLTLPAYKKKFENGMWKSDHKPLVQKARDYLEQARKQERISGEGYYKIRNAFNSVLRGKTWYEMFCLHRFGRASMKRMKEIARERHERITKENLGLAAIPIYEEVLNEVIEEGKENFKRWKGRKPKKVKCPK